MNKKNVPMLVFQDVSDERSVIEVMTAQSPEFRRFYEDNRPHIIKPIVWRVSSQHREARLVKYNDQSYVIELPLNATPSDVAHELIHGLLFERGFPSVADKIDAQGKYTNAGQYLNWLLLDPLVFETQATYFNLRGELRFSADHWVRTIAARPDPAEPRKKSALLNACEYVAAMLCIEAVTGKQANEIADACRRWHDVSRMVNRIEKVISRHDRKTPNGLRGIWSSLIREYQLSAYVEVK